MVRCRSRVSRPTAGMMTLLPIRVVLVGSDDWSAPALATDCSGRDRIFTRWLVIPHAPLSMPSGGCSPYTEAADSGGRRGGAAEVRRALHHAHCAVDPLGTFAAITKWT
jgi:hypothetical protein